MRLALCCIILAGWATSAQSQYPDGRILLFNMQVNEDGSAGDVDYSARSAQVTELLDGRIGKIIIAVCAQLSGFTQSGIAGAEFYIDGLEESLLPPGWTKTVYPAAGTWSLGSWSDPHVEQGEIRRRANIAWSVDHPNSPMCQRDPFVLLGRIELVSPPGEPSFSAETLARVVAADPPSIPALACPLLLACDAPVFSASCVQGGELCMGAPDVSAPSAPFPADQATQVSPGVVLNWERTGNTCCFGLGTPWTKIYLGTTPDPALAFWDYDGQRDAFDPPGDLALDTTYFWRIEWTHDQDCGYATSPVWSFTTGSVAVEELTWGEVRQLFR